MDTDENSIEAQEVWRDTTRSFPPLQLPDSSLDLLIPPGPILSEVFTIYETLRFFQLPLKLTPFRIEDFCAALVAREHNALISGIFCAILKVLFKSDELLNIQYGPADMRDGVAIYTSFVDFMNWPIVLKVYAASDPEHFSSLDQDKLANLCYEDVEVKVKTLDAFVGAALDSEVIREFTTRNKTGPSDEEGCRYCQQKGDLNLCDSCPAGYHLKCAEIEDETQIENIAWECHVCKQNKVLTVSDCINSFEKDSQNFLRQKPLGHDRHGRSYWLIGRRVVILSNSSKEVWYYSTKLQLDALLDVLDPSIYELPLCKQFDELQGEITEQMEETLKPVVNFAENLNVKPVKYLDAIENPDLASTNQFSQSPLPKSFQIFPEFETISRFFRYGMEGRFRRYINHYIDNDLALTKKDHQDKKTSERELYKFEYERYGINIDNPSIELYS